MYYKENLYKPIPIFLEPWTLYVYVQQLWFFLVIIIVTSFDTMS